MQVNEHYEAVIYGASPEVYTPGDSFSLYPGVIPIVLQKDAKHQARVKAAVERFEQMEKRREQMIDLLLHLEADVLL